ncbi:hypothetical protein KAR91_63530, partial [Candidatus Pacearchaeota archaeon]|nr:hypothetical protein [Candidatus Pacearchaeota archaeon]
MKRSPEKSKCLTTREAVFMVVGFLFGGFATVAYLSEKEDSESTKRSEVSKVINIQVCEVGELDDEEKKKEPNEVLSTGQECGLSSEQISDSEILSRAHGIETKRLIEKMEDIFDEYCITNEEDRAAIENMVMEGYSEVFSVGELIHEKGQVWEMELENPTLPKVDDSLFSETVVLTEMPCKVDSPEEIEVSPGQEEIIRMLKEGKFLELWESRVDVDWMRKIANDVDLGSELSDFFDLLDSIQGKLKET